MRSPAGGVLAISAEDTKEPMDGIVLTISDDGVGIAAHDLPKVFDAFFTTRNRKLYWKPGVVAPGLDDC